MIADLVCASDGLANLGSVAEGSRLNVLLSHHMQVAIVFGDKNYIKCTVTGDARADSRSLRTGIMTISISSRYSTGCRRMAVLQT